MDEYNFPRDIASLFEFVGTAIAHIDNRHMLHRSKRGRPRDGNTTHAELDFRNLGELRIESGPCGADSHLGCALRPGMRNGELFGVDALRVSSLEHLHAPLDR